MASTRQSLTCHCGICAGLPQEGVAALQEAGLWRYAATLTAHTLKGDERAAALERWAAHVHQVRPALPSAALMLHSHFCTLPFWSMCSMMLKPNLLACF